MYKDKIKRFAIMFCAIALLISLLPIALATGTERYGYKQLTNDAQRAMYNALVDGVKNFKTEITFSAPGITDMDILFAEDMFLADYPEYFWFDTKLSTGVYTDGTVETSVVNGYKVNGQSVDASNIDAYITAVETAANRILAGMPAGSDYDKALYLHDYLAENITYVSKGDHQTVYGALISGEAVCAGYTRAYQYLMQKAGFDCWYVVGNAFNELTQQMESHAWNLVFLDGKCYYTDVTWDDQPERLLHTFYMISFDEMQVTHKAKYENCLPAKHDHNDQGYFSIKGGPNTGLGLFSSDLIAEVFASWCKKVETGKYVCVIQDNTDAMLTWLSQNGADICRALGLSNASSSCSYLWNEYMIEFMGTEKQEHVHDSPLQTVAAKIPTCTAGGNIEYYTCSGCNKIFADQAGTQEITDTNSIQLPPTDHSYSTWSSDSDCHWKACSCGAADLNSKVTHTDGNIDRKCDACGFELPEIATSEPETEPPVTQAPETSAPTAAPTEVPTEVPTEATTQAPTVAPTEAPTEVPTEAPTETPTQAPTAEPTEEPTENPTEVSTEAPTEESTEPITDEPTQQETEEVTTPSTSATEETLESTEIGSVPTAPAATEAPATNDNEENSSITPVLIGTALVLIVIGGGIAIVIRIKKKK